MKIYTEEQVRKAMATYMSSNKVYIEQVIQTLTPIELPNDEEIEQEFYYKVNDYTDNPYASFKLGAKWIKEQILNQNK